MRSTGRMIGVCGFALFMGAGCIPWMKKDSTDKAPPAPTSNAVPESKQLIDYVNSQAKQITRFYVDDLDVYAKAQGQTAPRVHGYMICEKPLNFRLVARAFGIQQVDFGSNNEKFWFWVKESPDQALFHCSHDAFAKGNVQLPFPFEPQWVLEALGMAELEGDPAEYRVETKDRTFELIHASKSSAGAPVTKVMIFNRTRVNPPLPQVLAHEIRDSNNQVLASATIKQTKLDPKKGIAYPRQMILEWKPQQLTMELNMDGVEINEPVAPQQLTRYFTMPQLDGYKVIDLAANPTSNRMQSKRSPR